MKPFPINMMINVQMKAERPWGRECSNGFSRMKSWNGSRSLAQTDYAGTDHILAFFFTT